MAVFAGRILARRPDSAALAPAFVAGWRQSCAARIELQRSNMFDDNEINALASFSRERPQSARQKSPRGLTGFAGLETV